MISGLEGIADEFNKGPGEESQHRKIKVSKMDEKISNVVEKINKMEDTLSKKLRFCFKKWKW